MILPSKILIPTFFLIYFFNGALCARLGLGNKNSFHHMQCLKHVEPLNPELDCKYGYERNSCNKTSCLQGPDAFCMDEEWGLISGRCADGLLCVCGFCMGCSQGKCSEQMCRGNSIVAKRVPQTKPLWIGEYYFKKQLEEKRRLQQLELQQQQMEERQRDSMQSPRNFINLKSSMDRLSFYPFINNLEYPSNNDD